MEPCLFIHRTAVVMSDGTMAVCSRPYSPVAGDLTVQSFEAVWNGPVLAEFRSTLNTDREQGICRNCWYRDGKYHSQRFGAPPGEATGEEEPANNPVAWVFADESSRS